MLLKLETDRFNAELSRQAKIRYLTIVVDLSKAACKQDMRPSRAAVVKDLVSSFMRDFVDQNPLAQVAIVLTYSQTARIIATFNNFTQTNVSLYQTDALSDQTSCARASKWHLR